MTKSTEQPPRVAVVGAGVAGLCCAQRLAAAGCEVQVFEKSRGPGGRLSTRRLAWVAPDGTPHEASVDHGCPAFEAQGAGLAAAVAAAERQGVLARWSPRGPGGAPRWLGTPAANAWGKALAAGLPLHTGHRVVALQRDTAGWALAFDTPAGTAPAGGFAAVVLALPPAQAAPLLAPWRADWQAALAAADLAPCWTLMGVTDAVPDLGWDAAQPPGGPLAWLSREDTKPGRTAVAGASLWVAQASAAWSREHLEAADDAVRATLQQAVQGAVGAPLRWQHALVHRWRYARSTAAPGPGAGGWWDATLRLGTCGDHLGGGDVAGAWRSGLALAEALLGPAEHHGGDAGGYCRH